jgi:type II secretory pathway pseudopilin PulG
MSIITILIGLLVPALNQVRRYARNVRQKAQLHSIDTAIELYANEFDGYPDSGALDGARPPAPKQPYCGAMKLCEAMMGQDMLGFHTRSTFQRDGLDAAGNVLYYTNPAVPPAADSLDSRKGPFLPAENANAFDMDDIYGSLLQVFDPNSYVLCDVFSRQQQTGIKTGMPILYYRADTANKLHDAGLNPTATNSMGNIYNYWDNHALVGLPKPWEGAGSQHSLAAAQGTRFYDVTRRLEVPPRPYREDSYILLSAGFDGEYGTVDDIYNFEWDPK